MGGIAGLLAVFYLSGKSTRSCKRTRRTIHEFQEGGENFKMIRVYNPLWIPTYQKTETTTALEPTGPGFEVLQNWKMEPMVPPEDVPPLGNESMASFDSTWGGDGNPRAPVDPSQGRGRARKFSVKWSQDQDSGGRTSATYGGLEGGSAKVGFEEGQSFGGPGPPPPGAFPEAPPGTEPLDPFANAFGGFGFGDSSSPPPPPPGGTGGKKAFTGFGDEDDDEDDDDAPPPPSQSRQSSSALPPSHTAGFAGASGDPLPPPPPQANHDPFSISFNDEQAPPPPPGMDNSFNVSFGDPPPPPPSFS
ncbi:hypothetical protein Mapa_008563 [Marchantia paleacea]|nr:hypothetical protein Mapa_008563 [Marchantia paleacea]